MPVCGPVATRTRSHELVLMPSLRRFDDTCGAAERDLLVRLLFASDMIGTLSKHSFQRKGRMFVKTDISTHHNWKEWLPRV